MPKFLDAIAGFGVTLGPLFKKPITEQYPEKPGPVAPRYHGRHQLNRYADGLEKCIGCELCAWACPADAIYVEGADNTEEERFSPGERYGRVYQINYLRCIGCETHPPDLALLFGEQPVGHLRSPLEDAAEAGDLDGVDADADQAAPLRQRRASTWTGSFSSSTIGTWPSSRTPRSLRAPSHRISATQTRLWRAPSPRLRRSTRCRSWRTPPWSR